ncbi:hypothetical protein LTS08_004931 [Lithohypha guttulata]|uniref:Pathogen-related protein n=1 Tax=Lithohypha guttulata TaxID=1690604 RepID=A0AAN7T3E2_9EURO|nr:hypothetical protein LTR05_002223 [Lithohypha guttulata]KAK5101324.1 hypothetical protein LTS08_004931 [Lithohypha guttulata]
MADTQHETSRELTDAAPGVPDYMLDPDAVLKDEATWRHGSPPDYSGTRKIWAETKRSNHAPGSLESMVENLVKNWEIEASHKMKLSDWRTIDANNYTFSINGGPKQDGEHMLKVGTYNAIITPNEWYDANYTDFEQSHKTFRDMMPNFAWEVTKVHGGPPDVSVDWRHWGVMRSDYVGWNNKGEEIRIKAHGKVLDISGTTRARVNDKMQVTSLETFFDPEEMFKQMKPDYAKAEVLVDGEKLDPHTATEMLEHPAEAGLTSLVDKVKSDQDAKFVPEQQRDGDKAITDRDDVHLHHPAAPTSSDQLLSEQRESGGGQGCPFLPGGRQ